MSVRQPFNVEPDSDTARLLRLVGEEPVSIVSEGVKYRVEREAADPFVNYDPEAVREALHGAIGLYEGVDIEAFKREIREQRGHDPCPCEDT